MSGCLTIFHSCSVATPGSPNDSTFGRFTTLRRAHSIGGAPQLLKVYEHLNTQPFAVTWPGRETTCVSSRTSLVELREHRRMDYGSQNFADIWTVAAERSPSGFSEKSSLLATCRHPEGTRGCFRNECLREFRGCREPNH